MLSDPQQPPALRFQQTSGMVMAKGVEDCSFYRWSRLTSLNEVGADPSVFSVTAEEWHDAMAARQRDWPHAMTALSTHDTKRGEDVRARITALAEVPDVWAAALDRLLDLVPLPDPGFGNLLWQAIVGAWPATGLDGDWRERLHGYAEKAMREAGDRTTWTAPDEAYEARGPRGRRRRRSTGPTCEPCVDEVLAAIAEAGLEQRPVRQARRAHDARRAGRLPGQRAVGAEPGRPRQPAPGRLRRTPQPAHRRSRTACARRWPEGSTTPVPPSCSSPAPACWPGASSPTSSTPTPRSRRRGEAAEHVLAFDRGGAVTVVDPAADRASRRRGGWRDTTLALPAGEWVDAVTGRLFTGDAPVAEVLADLPVALLLRSSAPLEAVARPLRRLGTARHAR